MSDIIDVIDPRGKKIVCTKQCWYGHVLIRHPFLRTSVKAIKKTVEKPDFINQDTLSQKKEIYYRKSGNSYFRVVVEFSSNNGEFRTVYKSDSVKNGEVQLWP